MLESEQEGQQIEEISVPSVENVDHDQIIEETSSNAENKLVEGGGEAKIEDSSETKIEGEVKVDEAPQAEKPADSVDAKPEEGKIDVDSKEKAMEGEGSDTTIESDIDSDFDNIEEVDPSWGIDPTLWKSIQSFDEVDLKPAKAAVPEGEEVEETKEDRKRKKEEADAAAAAAASAAAAAAGEEEDSGFSEIKVRSEKERDEEFQEYIRELCRPQIVSYFPDRVASIGSTVRLTCTVKGNNIQTKWMKDENVLERKKNVQTKSDGEIFTLEITEITEKDAGVYTAQFKNRAGEVETSSTIKVFDGKLHKPDHIDIALVKGKTFLL